MLLFDNAILWAHFQVRGGLKSLINTALIYGVLLGGTILLTAKLDSPGISSAVMNQWTTGLLLIQGGLLVFFGSARIGAAIRHDLLSRMIESNRLMPIRPAEAVAGYIAGPTAQALGMGTATLLLGAVTSSYGGMSLDRWLAANVVLGLLVLLIWVLSAFGAFLARSAIIWVVIPAVFGMLINGELLQVLPGMCVIIAPLSVIFPRGGTSAVGAVTGAMLISAAAQLAFGVIFYAGATRKYRSSTAPPLGPLLCLLLLATWSLVSLIGIADWTAFQPFRLFYSSGTADESQVVATMVVTLLVAAIPAGSAAMENLRWDRLRAYDATPRRKPVPAPLLALVATAVFLLPGLASPTSHQKIVSALEYSAIAAAAYLVGLTYFIRLIARFSKRTILLPILWIALTWLVPVLLEVIWRSNNPNSDPFGQISVFGPAGLVVSAWTWHPINLVPGLIFQVGLAAALAIAYYQFGRVRMAKTMALSQE